MIKAIIQYNFLQYAILGAILASIACGIIGTIIIEKRMVMMSGGIAHTSFGGIGLGYLLNIEPIIGALVFAIIAAFGITTIKRKSQTHADFLIAIFWSVGMALGILFISMLPGYPPDVTSYLFGDILTVSLKDLWFMLILDIFIVGILWALFNYFKAFLFDEDFTASLGINSSFLEYLLFTIISFTIVVLIRVAGIILIIALLTIPPAIIRTFSYDLKKIMILSVFLGIILCLTGLWISYELNIASGASIVLLSAIIYLVVFILKRIYSIPKKSSS